MDTEDADQQLKRVAEYDPVYTLLKPVYKSVGRFANGATFKMGRPIYKASSALVFVHRKLCSFLSSVGLKFAMVKLVLRYA